MPVNYEDLVEQMKLRAMAEDEGKLRGRAEVLLASISRMQKIVNMKGSSEETKKLLESIQLCTAQAMAMIAEADEIRARVPKKPEPAKHTVEDVIQTLEEKCEPLITEFTTKTDLGYAIRELRAITAATPLAQRRNLLQQAIRWIESIAWPAGADAYAGACLRVLNELITDDYPVK